jgi:hypothetical protein
MTDRQIEKRKRKQNFLMIISNHLFFSLSIQTSIVANEIRREMKFFFPNFFIHSRKFFKKKINQIS